MDIFAGHNGSGLAMFGLIASMGIPLVLIVIMVVASKRKKS